MPKPEVLSLSCVRRCLSRMSVWCTRVRAPTFAPSRPHTHALYLNSQVPAKASSEFCISGAVMAQMLDENYSISARRQYLRQLQEQEEKEKRKKRKVEPDELVKKEEEKEGEEKEKRRRLVGLWLNQRGGWTIPPASRSPQ